MFFPIFKTIYKKKEAKISLLFCLFPLILIVTSFLPTNFMQLNGDDNSISCMEFFEAVVFVQFQLILPSISFMYLAITCVHDEIKNGRLYLYKDIPRKYIFLYKTFCLIIWYLSYVIGTFLTSIFTYYVYVIKQPYASGLFFPPEIKDAQYMVISLLGTILSFVISLILVIVLSIFLNNVASLIIGILFILFSSIAPYLEKINLLFPTGYINEYEKAGFSKTVLIILLLFALYVCIIGTLGNYKIKRIEF